MLSYLLAGTTIGPVVSQTLLDLMLFLILVYFAKESFKHKFQNFSNLRKPYLFEYGFIFYIISIVAGFLILGITDPEAWARLSKFYWIINFYLLVWTISRYKINLVTLIKFFSWAFLAPNIYAVLSLFYGYDIIRQKALPFRLTGLLDSATYHAHSNALIFVFFLSLLFFKFNKLSRFYKVLSIAAAFLMGLGIFMTYTRGIWLSIACTVFVFLFSQHRKLLFLVIIAGSISTATLYHASDSFRTRTTSKDTKESDALRWNLIQLHLDMAKDSPLFGIGYSNSLTHTPTETWVKYGYPANNTNSHAHNQMINVLGTTGFFGLISFSLFYFWFLLINIKLVLKFKKENLNNFFILAVACLTVQFEFFIANLTDIGFEYAKIRSLILLVWALVFCMWQNRVKISQSAPARS